MRTLGMASAADVNLRQILDNTLAFVGILDREGTLLEVNSPALTAGGLTREDVVGKPFWDCYWWCHDVGVRNQLISAHQSALNGEIVRYDAQVRMANEELMWIDFRVGAMRDSEGHITHLVPSGVDLTSRKSAEEKIRASEQKFRGVFDNAFVGVALVAIDGQWLEVNDQLCAILGFSRSELLTKTFQDITHPDDLQKDLNNVQALLSGQISNYQMDKRYIRRDGETVWASLTVALHFDDRGRPNHFISIVDDISERVKVEERQRVLMAEMAHRLKNQLAIVQAVASQTARYSPTTRDFNNVFAARLSALGTSVDLMVHGTSSISLRELAYRHLSSFSKRFELSGDDISIDSEAAETLGLAFHELATNCTKYGAWSSPTGFLNVAWRKLDGSRQLLKLSWVEAGGPEVRPPVRKGFGTQIVETIVVKRLSAKVMLDFAPSGFQWHVEMPYPTK
jgi:PAS domain S-box-containing protein